MSSGGKLPIALLSAVDLDSSLGMERWVVGLSIGGPYRAVAVSSGGVRSPNDRLERISLGGVASSSMGAR